jgi:hypothetical protein
MIAKHQDDLSATGKLTNRALEREPLFWCRPGRMDQITEKDDQFGRQFVDSRNQFCTDPIIANRPELSSPAQRPPIAEVDIRHDRSA